MAISSAERGELFKLAVGFFNASPGTTYLSELTSTYEALRTAGLSQAQAISAIGSSLDNTGAFTAIYPNFQTSTEFANAWLGTLGLAGNTIATDFVVSQLNGGADKGAVMLAGLNALLAYNGGDATLNAAKALLQNKIAAAEYYTLTLGGSSTDLAALQASLSLVTSNPSSVAAQNAANDAVINPPPASSATLTTDVDTVVLPEGGTVSAPRAFYPGGQVLVNTLQTEDEIVVQGGNGTLNAQLVQLGMAESPATYIGPNRIEGVKTVNVELLGGSVELDLQDDNNADITDVNLNKVRLGLGGDGSMFFTNLQDNVQNLAVRDTGANGMDSVLFLFENNFEDMNGGSKDINLVLDDISVGGSLTIMDDDGTAFDDLNITVDDASIGFFTAYATDILAAMSGDFYVGGYEDDGNVDTMVFTGRGDLWWGDTGWNQTLFDASALVDERPGDTSDVYVDVYRMLQVEYGPGPDEQYNEQATIRTAGGDDWIDGRDIMRSFDGAVIETNGGDDWVEIGNFWWGSGYGDIGDNTLIDTGDGDDVVLIGGTLLTNPLDGGDDLTPDTLITTGAGDDEVMIGGGMETGTEVRTGTGDDVVSAGGWLYDDDGDGVYEVGEFYSYNWFTMNGRIDLGDGNDQANVSYVGYDGVIVGGNGNDQITVYDDLDGEIYGDNEDGSGSGNDVVKVDGDVAGWNEDTDTWDALIDTAGGDDTVWVGYTIWGTVNTGSGNDTVEVGKDVYGNTWWGVLDGTVDLGDGDDTIVFWAGYDNYGNTEIITENARLEGGAGVDTMIVNVDYDNDFWIDGADDYDGDGLAPADPRITGIEHLIVNYLDKDIDWRFVDLSAFDDALIDVTLNNDLGWWDNEGDYYNVDGERFIITSEEHTGWWWGYDDDNWIDFTLNVTGADVSGDDDTLLVTLAATGGVDEWWWDFDVSIDDQTFERDGTFYENLDLTIADSYSHAIWLNNDFGGQTDPSLDDPEGTADGKITLTGGAAGQLIELWDMSAGTVAAGGSAANIVIDLDEDQNHDITTGSGNDTVYAAGLDGDWDEITEFDAIDLGAGRDRLVISDANQALGDIVTGSDEDFANKKGIEELQVLGDNSSIELMLDDDAYDAGIDTLILTEYDGYSSDAVVRLGDDFERDLTVVMEEDSTIELTNESSKGLLSYDLTFNLFQLDDSENNYQYIWLNGADRNNVVANIQMGQYDSLGISDSGGGVAGDDIVEIDINNRDGNDLDKIVLTEATPPQVANYTDNGPIEIELSADWQRENGLLTIDAGAIGDNDRNASNVATPNSATGGMSVYNNAGVDYRISVVGTANDDYVEGTAQADSISGGAGNDELYGGAGNDTIDGGDGDDLIDAGDGNDLVTGGAGGDMIVAGAGNDTVDGGAGNDWIRGGAGNDDLTGGAGRDTFVFEDTGANNGRDAIRDFTAGNNGDVFNFGAQTLGGGIASGNPVDAAWENAVNENTGAITMIQAIDLAGANKATVDDEIMVVRSAAINAEANSLVAGWLAGASTTGVVITGSQGASEIYVWYFDNAIDGDNTQVTAEDVSLVGIVTMASGTIDSLTAITGVHTTGNIDIFN